MDDRTPDPDAFSGKETSGAEPSREKPPIEWKAGEEDVPGDGDGRVPRRKPDPDFDGPWTHRVAFASKAGGRNVAFRPRQVLTDRGPEAVEIINSVVNRPGARLARVDREVRNFSRIVDVEDPIRAVAELRRRGFVSQLNTVYFAQGGCGCGCGCGSGGGCPPHPSGGWASGSYAQSVHPTPYGASSVHPTPYGASSVHPTPYGSTSVHPTPGGGGHGCGCGCGCHGGDWGTQSVHPTPYGASSVHPTPYGSTSVHPTPYGGHGCGCGCGGGGWGTQSVHPTPYGASSVHPTPYGSTSVHPTPGPRRSSARPTAPNEALKTALTAIIGTAQVEDGPQVIVLDTGLATGDEFPPAFANAPIVVAEPAIDNVEYADSTNPADDLLDEVAGHGTFIAGLVDQVAPGCRVIVHRVLASVGDTDEERVVERLESLLSSFDDPEHTILSLSFGGYVLEFPILLAAVIADIQAEGVVVVAAAGNDGTCEPMYPGALPGVVSVGAIGPHGPAHFSNFGSWVRACAPGVDLMSTFFQFSGATPAPGGQQDPDNFNGWALWSGTSFSAPVVAGALARTMMLEGGTASDAVSRVVDNPYLLRIPGLGTVVNVI